MKNIYFVQAGVLYGVNAYFPYAAGCIAAYAWNNPIISEHYRIGPFVFLRNPIPETLASMEEPFMVAFSCYVWNYEYHKALAAAVKERWPDCYIVFGGHQVLNESSEQLEELAFVDFLMHKAGEIPFERLLLALLQGAPLQEVPSISFRTMDGMIIRTEEEAFCCCDFPSPYLTGLFDGLLTAHPDLLFSMTFETNRGCPYSCAYCDWGTVRQAVQLMPLERIYAEIDWAAQHAIEFVCCADANFGLLERDERIADYLVAAKRRAGYPKKLSACFAKISNERVFRINKTLGEHGLNSGATISFQSLSPLVLKEIGRDNLTFERFQALTALYNKHSVPVYSELILGLPGETKQSYTQGIGTLLAAGMHGALEVFPCELLPNARLASSAYKEAHGIQSIQVRQLQRHGTPENQDDIPEYSEIICQTAAMSREEWVESILFSTLVQGLHSLGLIPYAAVYLYWERQYPYERFYLDLLVYAERCPSTLMGEWVLYFKECYQAFVRGHGQRLMYYHPSFGEVTWPLGEALFLRIAYEADRFYAEIPDFLRQYGLPQELCEELLRYQRAMVCLPESPPQHQAFSYDFPSYFADAFSGQPAPLEKRNTSLRFGTQTQALGWPEFAREYVWYGRRKGALSRKEYEVSYE